MNTVVFIGHSECYGLSLPSLEKVVVDCIHRGAIEFFSGGQGAFDRICARTVFRLKGKYPYVRNTLVIPYPSFRIFNRELFDEVLYPQELEHVPFKAAIPRRNNYMVKQADVAVCFIDHFWGNAAKTYALAQKEHLQIFNLSQTKENPPLT